MRKQIRYGDEETIITLREQAVAGLFVVAIAALLIGASTPLYDEPSGKLAGSDAAMHLESGTAANLPDDSGRTTGRSPSEAP